MAPPGLSSRSNGPNSDLPVFLALAHMFGTVATSIYCTSCSTVVIFDQLEFWKPDPTAWSILRPSDYVGKLSHLLRVATRPFRENISRILLMDIFPPPWEVCRPCVDGIATLYNNIMEHAAIVIICKKNPNVSETGVSCQTKN